MPQYPFIGGLYWFLRRIFDSEKTEQYGQPDFLKSLDFFIIEPTLNFEA